MFDLLGYWSIVSVLTFSLMMPIFLILYHATIAMVGKILNDDWEGRKVVRRIVSVEDDGGIFYKNKLVVNSLIMWVTGVGGFFYTVAVVMHVIVTSALFGDTLINFANFLATKGAPVGLWVVLPVVVYYSIIYCGRKYIKVKAKLDTITSKLKEMDNV